MKFQLFIEIVNCGETFSKKVIFKILDSHKNNQTSALKTLKIDNDKDKCINLVGLYSKLGLNG